MEKDIETLQLALKQVKEALQETLKNSDTLDRKATLSLGYVSSVLVATLGAGALYLTETISSWNHQQIIVAIILFLSFSTGGLITIMKLYISFKPEKYHSSGHSLENWDDAPAEFHSHAGLHELLIKNYQAMLKENNITNRDRGNSLNLAFKFVFYTLELSFAVLLIFLTVSNSVLDKYIFNMLVFYLLSSLLILVGSGLSINAFLEKYLSFTVGLCLSVLLISIFFISPPGL